MKSVKNAASPVSTQETEGDTDELRKTTEEGQASEEERFPSFTVTFTKAGIEIVVFKMNHVSLSVIERAQHILFQRIMQARQQEYQAQRLTELKETS